MIKRIGTFMGPGRRSSGTSSTPTPPLTSLAAWFAADAGTFTDTARTSAASTNGANVKGWADQSGNARHLSWVSGSVPTLKTNAQNSKPSVNFATLASMSFPSNFLIQPGEIWYVLKRPTSGNTEMLSGVGGSSYYTLHSQVGWQFTDQSGGFIDMTIRADAAAVTGFTLFHGVLNTSAVEIDVNDGTLTAQSAATNPLMTLQKIGSGSGGLDAEVLEMLFYTAVLTAGTRSSVRSYLNTKYAIY